MKCGVYSDTVSWTRKEGRNPDTCYATGDPWGPPNNSVGFYLQKVLGEVKTMRQAVTWQLPGTRRKWKWGTVGKWWSVSVLQDE